MLRTPVAMHEEYLYIVVIFYRLILLSDAVASDQAMRL